MSRLMKMAKTSCTYMITVYIHLIHLTGSRYYTFIQFADSINQSYEYNDVTYSIIPCWMLYNLINIDRIYVRFLSLSLTAENAMLFIDKFLYMLYSASMLYTLYSTSRADLIVEYTIFIVCSTILGMNKANIYLKIN